MCNQSGGMSKEKRKLLMGVHGSWCFRRKKGASSKTLFLHHHEVGVTVQLRAGASTQLFDIYECIPRFPLISE